MIKELKDLAGKTGRSLTVSHMYRREYHISGTPAELIKFFDTPGVFVDAYFIKNLKRKIKNGESGIYNAGFRYHPKKK